MTSTHLADLLANALQARALPLAQRTPRQPSTAVTPEFLDIIIAVRNACATAAIGDLTPAQFADQLNHLSPQARHLEPPTIVDSPSVPSAAS